jgi:hypothetical protein
MSSKPTELQDAQPVELAEPTGFTRAAPDHRPLMPEPPPVRILAVEDVRLPAAAGLEKRLDAFYVVLLEFEREPTADAGSIVYRAENIRLRFDVVETQPPRQDYRTVVVEVRSLADAEFRLIELELEYERTRGLTPGEESLFVRDPAGHCVSIVQRRELM